MTIRKTITALLPAIGLASLLAASVPAMAQEARGPLLSDMALSRLAATIELTADQQALFEALRAEITDARDALVASRMDLRGEREPGAEQTFDPVARLNTRIALESAQLAALEAIEPAYSAFFGSLTPEQTAALSELRGEGRERMGQRRPGGFGPGMEGPHGPGQHGPRPGPAGEMTPPAPEGQPS